jgi:LysR family transcriptional regulator, low CO2-responsive transcriptional regulator
MIHTQLRSFHAVASEGGFTAASRKLNIGQPTITSQVRALEDYFKVELFVRRGRRVELTDAGRQLHTLTQRLMTLEQDASDLLRGLGGLQRGTLKVGAVGPYHVTEMLASFHRLYPGVRLMVMIRNSREVLQQLLEFSIDVAVLAHVEDDPRVVAIPYSRHPVVAFVNRGHPWAGRGSVSIHDFSDEQVVLREEGSTTRLAFEQALADHRVRINPVLEFGSREAVWMAVERGLGVGVVSDIEFIPHPNLVGLPIHDCRIETIAHVAYLKEREESRIIQAFVSVARDLRVQQDGRKAASRPS